MKKLALIFGLVFCLGYTTTAQSNDTIKPFTYNHKHNIGLHAGLTTGIGISYRYWPTKLGIQLTSIPIISNKRTFVSAGITALYTLNDGQKVDLYGYFGNHILYSKTTKSIGITQPGQPTTIIKESTNYNVGVGFGFKIDINQDLNFNLQAGYGVYVGTHTIATLDAAIGLYYSFN